MKLLLLIHLLLSSTVAMASSAGCLATLLSLFNTVDSSSITNSLETPGGILSTLELPGRRILFRLEKKLRPTNSPHHEVVNDIGLTIPIINERDGLEILSNILDMSIENLQSMRRLKISHGLNVMLLRTGQREDNLGQGRRMLTIALAENADQSAYNFIITRLRQLNLRTASPNELVYNLDRRIGQEEWVFAQFYHWSSALTRDEAQALYDIGGPAYRAINNSLRRGQEREIMATINHLDRAILRRQSNINTVHYRAVERTDLQNIWDEIHQAGDTNGQNIPQDPGYIFTSLDINEARWWRRSYLRNRGLILEMHVPSGTPMAYMEDVRLHDDRAHLEFVLPRNLNMRAIGAYLDVSGIPVLEVEVIYETL